MYGQYIDYSEKKKKEWPKGFIYPYTGTIFYNIRIYSRSQVSVYKTIGPLVQDNGTNHKVMLMCVVFIRQCEKQCIHNLCFVNIQKHEASGTRVLQCVHKL